MKKRLFVLLLTLCMVTAMFTGLGITAYAADDISADTTNGYLLAYTMQSGDTVSKVCTKLGVNFSKVENDITKINNISDYSKISIGKVILIPVTSVKEGDTYYTLKTHVVASGDSLAGICSAYGITASDTVLNRLNANLSSLKAGGSIVIPVYNGDRSVDTSKDTSKDTSEKSGSSSATSGSTSTSTSTSTSSSASTSSISADTVAYYLIPYTMQSGDTVAKVCTGLGIDFSTNQSTITKLNNISDYAKIAVGRTLLLPSTKAPSSGTCYKVMAHTLVSGDTLYKLCQAYGISFKTNQSLLKALNNSSNLNYVKAGSVLYIPVASTASSSGVNAGTSGITSGSTAYYSVAKASASNGSFAVKVSGIEVNSIAAGKTVTVIAQGNEGYVQDSLTVCSAADSTKIVTVTNNSFVMPAYNVTVTMTFKKAASYEIQDYTASTAFSGLDADEQTAYLWGNAYYTVKGADVQKAVAGSTVKVVTEPKTGYVVDKIQILKKNALPGKEVSVATAAADGTFTMPSCAVTIKVKYKVGSDFTYKLAAGTTEHGTFDFLVNKAVVNKAKAGDQVSLSLSTEDKYKVDSIVLNYTIDGTAKSVTLDATSFTMPAADTTVSVNYILSATYNLTAASAKNGSISFRAKGVKVTKAEEGRIVEIIPVGNSGYELDTLLIYKTGDKSKTSVATAGADNTFVMPNYAVTVETTFKKYDSHSIDIAADTQAKCDSIDITVKGKGGSTSAVTGSVVIVDAAAQEGYTIKSLKAVGIANEDWVTVISGNTFVMPAYDVEIVAEFVQNSYEVDIDNGTGEGSLTLVVKSKDLSVPAGVKPGDTVNIKNTILTAGYKLKNVTVSKKTDSTVLVAVNNNSSFVMPEFDVVVKAEWKEGTYAIEKTASASGSYVVLDEPNGDEIERAGYNDTVYILATANAGYKVKSVSVNSSAAAVVDADKGLYSFQMPDKKAEVQVEFETCTYKIEKNSPANGTLKVSVTGGDLSKVAYGDTVTIETKANEGYVLDELTVTRKGDSKTVVPVTGSTFTMPDYNVTITATYRALETHKQIAKAAVTNGKFTFQINGTDAVRESDDKFYADEGDEITVLCVPDNGYQVDTIQVVLKDDAKKTVPMTGANSFVMPGDAVKILVTFKAG